MGANFVSRVYQLDDRIAITSAHEKDQDQSRVEDGVSYSGEIGCLDPGIRRWHDRRFPTEREAHEFLGGLGREKRAPAEAVSFFLPRPPDPAAQKRAAEAHTRVRAAEVRVAEVKAEVLAEIRGTKSKTIGCKECQSAIARRFLGVGKTVYLGEDRDPRFTCPVCQKGQLTSATQQSRIAAACARFAAATSEAAEASKPTPSEKIGWIVGGWAPS